MYSGLDTVTVTLTLIITTMQGTEVGEGIQEDMMEGMEEEGTEEEPFLLWLAARWAKMSRKASLAEMKEGVCVNGRRLVAEEGSAGTETVRWNPSVTPGGTRVRRDATRLCAKREGRGRERTLSDA